MKGTSAFLSLVTFGWLATASGGVGVLTGPIQNRSNGHFYYLLQTSGWTDAQAQALTMGGNLATVRNATENQWIFDTFADYGGVDRFLWLGLNDAAVEDQFVWASGEPFGYSNWAPGEPNDLTNSEYYVQMFPANVARGVGFLPAPPGTWNDIIDSAYPYEGNPSGNNFGPIYGVVEIVPEPSGMSAAAVALGALWWRGKLIGKKSKRQ